MTCYEFKVGFFKVNGPHGFHELADAVQKHANACETCGEIFRGTLAEVQRKALRTCLDAMGRPREPGGRGTITDPDKNET